MPFNLAANIRYFREQNNWTQQYVADALNVSRSMIAKWENQSAQPDLHMLIKLSELFEISLDQLIGRSITKEHVLREIERIYSLEEEVSQQDENIIQLIDFIIRNKQLNERFRELARMPVKKQRIVLNMLEKLISDLNKI